MIFITGDCHSDFIKFSSFAFPEQKQLTKDDFVIICGDFGGIWAQKETKEESNTLDFLDRLPFTTLFIDGNHENFDRLNSYPIEKRYGGKVHVIRPSVLHLMRGEVFEIDGKTIFAFGGASSHDVSDGILDSNNPNWKRQAKRLQSIGKYMFRVKGISWWEEELPTEEEMKNGIINLKKYDNTVDYIITHTPSSKTLDQLDAGTLYEKDRLTDYLDKIRETVFYERHFMGHMHIDAKLSEKDYILYNQIIRIN